MKRVLQCVMLGAVALMAAAQYRPDAQSIPAYNVGAPTRPLPPLLAGAQLTGPYFSHPVQVIVYKMAARIPGVLHQEPCYCRCDREMGHNSLHSCFEGLHGAACSTCMKEAVFTYRQTRAGRTPVQIRAAIERGEWMNVDLEQVSASELGKKG